MATAVSAVANGGLLMEPRVVRAVTQNGRRSVVEPKVIRRAINPETAAIVTAIMEGVVERGTATSAKIPGYRVAGKTGTANQIAEGGGYSPNEYNASFVGFVPARKPAYTILVVIDAPKAGSHYGGSVAAPIFQRIAQAALLHAGVPPSLDPDRADHPDQRRADDHAARSARAGDAVHDAGERRCADARRARVERARGTEHLGRRRPVGADQRIGRRRHAIAEPGTPIESGSWSLLSLRRATAGFAPGGGKR
jgi:membrane peptidoglycan carboxypeptidase